MLGLPQDITSSIGCCPLKIKASYQGGQKGRCQRSWRDFSGVSDLVDICVFVLEVQS